MLSLPGQLPVVVGHHRAQRPVETAQKEGLGLADAHRGPTRVTKDLHQPTRCHEGHIGHPVMGIGAGLAKGGDRGHYKARVELL